MRQGWRLIWGMGKGILYLFRWKGTTDHKLWFSHYQKWCTWPSVHCAIAVVQQSVASGSESGLSGLCLSFHTPWWQARLPPCIGSSSKAEAGPQPIFLCWTDLALPLHKACKPSSTTGYASLEQPRRRSRFQTFIPSALEYKGEASTVSALGDITVSLRVTVPK